MAYIGNTPSTAAFPFDQFSGNGSTTAFTLSFAPAAATSIVIAISGVVQNPYTYAVVGTTLTFTAAPPTGTNNIAVLYLGLPVVASLTPGNTAYFSTTSFTATASQTVFAPSGTYQPGFINVIRNGAQLAPADYTATNGTTVTLNNACTAGDTVVIEIYNLTSITGALPLTGGTVTGATAFNSTLSVNDAYVSGHTGFKNRIINPGMVIDQRNAGASVTPTNLQYMLDRWFASVSQASKFTVQQNAGSVTPPVGFSNYLGVTSSSAYSVGAADNFNIGQKIEGYNFADMAWGTANASAVTLSFWVRSSLTGSFGASVFNNATNRSYPFSYTINSANTWEYKTVTIPGDTTGTWVGATNGIGLYIYWSLGCGSNYNGTANTWAGALYLQPSSATSVVGTNGATFYITGVQLERGSNATSFEFRDYGRELILCQRYFSMSYPQGTAPGAATTSGLVGAAAQFASGAGGSLASISYPVQMRSTPTISLWDGAGTSNKCSYTGGGNYTIVNNGTLHTTGATYISSTSFMLSPTSSAPNSQAYVQYTASAEL